MDAERIDWLRLHRSHGVGPLVAQRLLTRFGSASAILGAPQTDLEQTPGVGPAISAALKAAPSAGAIEAELDTLERQGGRCLLPFDPEYPDRLRQLPTPPIMLQLLGSWPLEGPCVALVGARRASAYGRTHSRRMARELARQGVLVISGLARGIDTDAHLGCLEVAAPTAAILGSGLGQPYPYENRGLLAELLATGGTVISELPWAMPPRAYHFPQRNRLIAALADAVVVLEAGHRSGALITARWALELGREVFALPGPVERHGSAGPHALLRDGAHLAADAQDVLEVLGSGRSRPGTTPRSLCQEVLAALSADGSPLAELLQHFAATPPVRVLAAIAELEQQGQVARYPGPVFFKR